MDGLALSSALLKHDAAIATAALRQLTKRIGDLLTVLVILPLLVVIARAWLSGLPDTFRELAAYGVSALTTLALTKTLLERVWFHQTDGVLASFAQRLGEWLGYTLPLLAVGVLLSLLGMAAMSILHFRSAMLGTCGGIASGLVIPYVRERVCRWWRDLTPRRGFALLRHQHALMIAAAVSVAVGTLCACLPQERYLAAIFTGGYGLAVILLTGRVDAGTVRYMTLVGHSSASLVRVWLPIQLALLLPATAVLLLAQSWVAAGVAAVIALGLPAITALRVFAYRAFSRVIADWMVTSLIAAAGYAALTFPPLGPVIIVGAVVWLAKRGSGSRWLLT